MPHFAPRVCLFDLDGTLIDSTELILTCFRHTFRTHLGAALPDEKWIAGIGTPLIRQLRSLVDDEALVQRMAATYRAYQEARHDQLLREFPGVRDALATLRTEGHAVGVVTSKMRAPALHGLRSAGLTDLIDVLIDAESVANHKPHPEPVLKALESLGCPPAEAVFVGDSPHDVVAGRSAGVRTIAVLCGPFPRSRLEPEMPDAIVLGVPAAAALITDWRRRATATAHRTG